MAALSRVLAACASLFNSRLKNVHGHINGSSVVLFSEQNLINDELIGHSNVVVFGSNTVTLMITETLLRLSRTRNDPRSANPQL